MWAPVRVPAAPFLSQLPVAGEKQWEMIQVFMPLTHVGGLNEAPGFGLARSHFWQEPLGRFLSLALCATLTLNKSLENNRPES